MWCDIYSCSPEEEISQPDLFSKAADAKANDQWNAGRIPGVPVASAKLWGGAAGWNVQKAQMVNEQKKKSF